jgi:cell division protein FtsL
MRNDLTPGVLIGKSIDNSQIVRELDPRASRELISLLLAIAVVVSGLVLYAWPHLKLRQTSIATERLLQERERLVEENRKLRLEKASLENLRRVEAIATHELGMTTPPEDHLYVIERPAPLPKDAQLAQSQVPASPAPLGTPGHD